MREVTESEFDEIIYDEEETAMVCFYRKDCSKCKQIKPMLENLERDFASKPVVFLTVNVEDNPVFTRFGLLGVPQVLVFADGQLREQIAGVQAKDDYRKKIQGCI